MFDLHITCSENIKTLNITFENGTMLNAVNSAEHCTAREECDKLSDKADNYMHQVKDVSKKPETKKTKRNVILPTDIISDERPIKIAPELNNLDI